MFTSPEQFSKATKDNFDAQLNIFSAFTSKAIESMEKVVELNLTVAKTSFEESNAALKQLISAKDVQDFFNLAASHTQPNTEKALAYARHFASITSDAHADLTKAAEAHVTDANRKFLEEISKNAPVGSENAIALLKSAVSAANAGYEQINKSAKQVAEALETNLHTAVNQISQATKTAQRSSKKAG